MNIFLGVLAISIDPEISMMTMGYGVFQGRLKQQGVDLIGPIALGGRFWSAYFYDPNGIRLELATNRLPNPGGIVESVLQSEAEAREELSTLFNDPATVQSWLDRMPLKAVQTQ